MGCSYAYRKTGHDTVHCTIQKEQAKKWDFCAHQYYCRNSGRYELNADAHGCAIKTKEEAKHGDDQH